MDKNNSLNPQYLPDAQQKLYNKLIEAEIESCNIKRVSCFQQFADLLPGLLSNLPFSFLLFVIFVFFIAFVCIIEKIFL